MPEMVPVRFTVHHCKARATKSRAQRLLRVDQANQSHDFQTLYANPAEEQGAIWILVASAGTMSHFTDYVTSRDLAVLAITSGQEQARSRRQVQVLTTTKVRSSMNLKSGSAARPARLIGT